MATGIADGLGAATGEVTVGSPLNTVKSSPGGGPVKFTAVVGEGREDDPIVPYQKNLIGGQTAVLVENITGANNQAVGDKVVDWHGGLGNLFVEATAFGAAVFKLYARRGPAGKWIVVRDAAGAEFVVSSTTGDKVIEFGFAKGVQLSAAVTLADGTTNGLHAEIK